MQVAIHEQGFDTIHQSETNVHKKIVNDIKHKMDIYIKIKMLYNQLDHMRWLWKLWAGTY